MQALIRLLIMYSKQRAPLFFVCTLGFILYASGMQAKPENIALFVTGYISMCLFLFLIRFSDDIADIDIDRPNHPERVLCSSDIDSKDLRILQLSLLSILLVLQAPNLKAIAFTLSACAFFHLFFTFKNSLPTLLNILILNSSLALFPLYYSLSHSQWQLSSSLHTQAAVMGLFFWLGGTAHDLSHDLIDPKLFCQKNLPPINQLNQQFLAWLSLLFFVIASITGMIMSALFSLSPAFGLALAGTSLIILFYEFRLIKQVNKHNASPFYIFGFVFFLLPALIHIINTNFF